MTLLVAVAVTPVVEPLVALRRRPAYVRAPHFSSAARFAAAYLADEAAREILR
jgi:hypothetical protein